MVFDGTRALVAGDYVTPKEGRHAGQLGPWSKIVSAMGIEPRSTLMKSIFVAYGGVWMFVTSCFALKLRWTWSAMAALAAGSLWYVPIGAAFSVLQLVLLFAIRSREPAPA